MTCAGWGCVLQLMLEKKTEVLAGGAFKGRELLCKQLGPERSKVALQQATSLAGSGVRRRRRRSDTDPMTSANRAAAFPSRNPHEVCSHRSPLP